MSEIEITDPCLTPETADQDDEFELSLWDALSLARVTANTPVCLVVTDEQAAAVVLGERVIETSGYYDATSDPTSPVPDHQKVA